MPTATKRAEQPTWCLHGTAVLQGARSRNQRSQGLLGKGNSRAGLKTR